MGHWKIDTPLEALELVAMNGVLWRGMKGRREIGRPGEIVDLMQRRQPELVPLLRDLRSEHMMKLREDYVKCFIDTRPDGMNELWRQWNEQMTSSRKSAS